MFAIKMLPFFVLLVLVVGLFVFLGAHTFVSFRDARAATVMAPTTDVLYDFIGKAVCGMPLFG